MSTYVFPLPERDEFRFPNATIPVREPVSANLSQFLSDSPIPSKASHDYDWGRIERSGSTVRVLPEKPGEHEFSIDVGSSDGSRRSVLCRITVNADPKTLWKIVEPPNDSPYRKSHAVFCSGETGCIRIIGASRRGRSHEAKGGFRDDDFGFIIGHDRSVFLLSVADGAGSAPFAREGSRLAVETSLATAEAALGGANWNNPDEIGKVLMRAAYAGFQAIVKKVEDTNKETPAPKSPLKWKDFNTTLLLAAVKRERFGRLRIVTFSIGDGAIVWTSDIQSKLLCSPDSGQTAGETRFLTSNGVWKAASSDWESFKKRIYSLEIPGSESKHGSLMLMTDGVSDAFFETDDDLSDGKQWLDFVSGLPTTNDDRSGKSDPEEEASRILDWLSFYKEGHHDDRTLLILRPTPKPLFARRPQKNRKAACDA